MRIINFSYAYVSTFDDPHAWLKRIGFSTGVLEALTNFAEVAGVYNIRYRGVVNQNGVTYHFPGYRRLGLLIPFLFNRFIRNLKPDVAIVHGLASPWQIIMLRWQLGPELRIIVHHHAEPPRRDIRRYLQQWADRYIHAYLFSAIELGQSWVASRQILEAEKIKVIMGSSSPFYVIEKTKARETVNVTGAPVFIWVGDLDINKDPVLTVKAFIRFLRSKPGASLYLIYQTDRLLGALKELVALASCQECIHFVGRVEHEQLLFWYNSSDFIISSSHYEGAGIAVCEALSCGCIPILTRIPSFRMMTDDGSLGLLFEAGNEESLLDALLRSPNINREAVRQSVLAQFESRLSFKANARNIMDVIRALNDK